MTPVQIPDITRVLLDNPSQTRPQTVQQYGTTLDISQVNWPQYPDHRQATATLAHNRTHLLVYFRTTGQHLRALVDTDQGSVSADSCFEIFIRPNPESPRYWNFEFNAIGHINASNRIERPNPTRLTPPQLAQITTLPSAGTQPFDEKPGTQTWSLYVEIPLALLELSYTDTPINILANIYKCGSSTSSPHYLSYAPINTPKPDFHRPEYFVPMTLL